MIGDGAAILQTAHLVSLIGTSALGLCGKCTDRDGISEMFDFVVGRGACSVVSLLSRRCLEGGCSAPFRPVCAVEGRAKPTARRHPRFVASTATSIQP